MRRFSIAATVLVVLVAFRPTDVLAAAQSATGSARSKSNAKPKEHPKPAEWIGEPISIDLKDADLRDVLHTFSKLASLNMVVDPDVKGSVTVRLHDVAWDQALDLIVRMNGYGYVLEGNVLRVGLPSKL